MMSYIRVGDHLVKRSMFDDFHTISIYTGWFGTYILASNKVGHEWYFRTERGYTLTKLHAELEEQLDSDDSSDEDSEDEGETTK